MATEKTVLGSTSEAQPHAEAQGLTGAVPGPGDADELGQDRRSCGDQGAARISSSTTERL